TRASFDAQRGPTGALLIGSPDEVVDKILRHSEALGGISRLTFQMNAASLPQLQMMRGIDAIAARVAPPYDSTTQSGLKAPTCTELTPSIWVTAMCTTVDYERRRCLSRVAAKRPGAVVTAIALAWRLVASCPRAFALDLSLPTSSDTQFGLFIEDSEGH